MKKKIITLITTLSLLCFVACGSESTETATTNVGAGNNQEAVTGTVTDEPTAKPEVEATAEPTTVPSSEAVEATTEPTEEPVLYPGIDMASDLPGEEWVETFVGIIEEPKIVVFSDETGRKEIFEKDSIIKFNPDADMIGIYLPDGYKFVETVKGITQIEKGYNREYFRYYKLMSKETRNKGVQTAALYAEYEGEEIEFPFVFVPQ